MKRVSLKDIATTVGVSTALVSYVMNGQEKEKRVGAEVVERIKKTAKELNYKPNQIARSLRKGSTKTIGLIVADISNPFFANLARVIEDEASKFGYTVIFGSSDEGVKKSSILIETLIDRQVDGFIIIPAENTEEQIKMLYENKIPLILVDRFFPNIETNYVVLDNFEASFDAVNQLIVKGHTNIGMIAYPSTLIHMQERIRGYEEAMKISNLSENIRIAQVRYGSVQDDVDKFLHQFLNGRKKVDALFLATNAITIATLYGLIKFNVKVPDDLALIGFDGNEAFDFFYSPLSFVEQPINEMGQEAVRLLIDQINGSTKISHVKMRHDLIIRNSCD
jgi:LacI family transcriptional regulator